MRFPLVLLTLLVALPVAAQPITGLAGWNIVIDPGHSFQQNVGAFGYSEAEKTLAEGLELRRLLLETTDIDTVYMTRTRGDVEVSLTQRTTYANQVGAAYYHSIHSDAGSTTANSTLIMYGGWRENGQTVEKTPHGGKRMAEFMDVYLTAAMRTTRRGVYADRTFYQGFPFEHANLYPYLHVNRESDMASTLSEAGFHTNPEQNQRNMNADWKRLEARALFYAILDYRGAERPASRIVTGIVRDVESGQPINGATVDVGGKTYTTDTFASLFNAYSTDPDLLRNGFYYIEDVGAGTQSVSATADGFAPLEATVTPIDTFFSFLDLGLVSVVPPTVTETSPAPDADGFRVVDPIAVTFSRPMDRASVEAAFALAPAVGGTFVWTNGDRTVYFRPDSLIPLKDYTLTIGEAAQSPYNFTLDGNGDGTAGDAFTLAFRTSQRDVVAPRIVDAFPRPNATEIDREPVISITFDEKLDATSVDPALFTFTVSGEEDAIPGTLQVADAGEQTVVSFAPTARLAGDTFYKLRVAPGLRDAVGNEVTSTLQINFRTRVQADDFTAIESFEDDFAYWWQPLQSGSTTPTTVGDSTFYSVETGIVNPQGGTRAMALSYGWFTQETGPFLIREYLGGGAPRNVFFDATGRVQARVFGDGSGTLFRFALDDEGQGGHEVSPWRKIDWKGWRLVEWDLANEAPGAWIGDGKLDGQLRFDSFQLSYDGGAAFGTIYIDDLRAARVTTTAIDDGGSPVATTVTLDRNQPNPFRDQTEILFTLPQTTQVTLRVFDALGRHVATLLDGAPLTAGPQRATWDASAMPSGTYLVRLDADGQVQTRLVSVVR